LQYTNRLNWSHNIWMGVSVENEKVTQRINDLRLTGARVKFLSCEPLIGPLPDMNLHGIDWVIVGGESGRKPRSMKEDWVLDILQQCEQKKVRFFFKQWGGTNKKKTGRILLDRTWDGMPDRFTMEEMETVKSNHVYDDVAGKDTHRRKGLLNRHL